jgi:hypothetical protein
MCPLRQVDKKISIVFPELSLQDSVSNPEAAFNLANTQAILNYHADGFAVEV